MAYLTTAQVAKLLMVSPASVRLWISKGWLNAQVTPGGHRRILRRDVENFARDRGLILSDMQSGTRVLIVDDEVQFAQYLKEVLERWGETIEVAVAHSGFEAGYLAHEFSPEVILLDLMMPTLDGFEVCSALKQDPQTRNIRVIAMTGYGSEDNVRRIISLGAERCLSKPFEVEDLLEALGLSRRPQGARQAAATRL